MKSKGKDEKGGEGTKFTLDQNKWPTEGFLKLLTEKVLEIYRRRVRRD